MLQRQPLIFDCFFLFLRISFFIKQKLHKATVVKVNELSNYYVMGVM